MDKTHESTLSYRTAHKHAINAYVYEIICGFVFRCRHMEAIGNITCCCKVCQSNPSGAHTSLRKIGQVMFIDAICSLVAVNSVRETYNIAFLDLYLVLITYIWGSSVTLFAVLYLCIHSLSISRVFNPITRPVRARCGVSLFMSSSFDLNFTFVRIWCSQYVMQSYSSVVADGVAAMLIGPAISHIPLFNWHTAELPTNV